MGGLGLGFLMHVTNNIMRHALPQASDTDLDFPARSSYEENTKKHH